MIDCYIIHVDDTKMQEDIILQANTENNWIMDSKIDNTTHRIKVPRIL